MTPCSYSIVYADPPWTYADRGCNGAAEKQYSTMTYDEIATLPVAGMVERDAVLFLWATFPKIEDALRLIPAWGFTYKSIAFLWVKTKGGKPFFGLGRWTRGNAEPCLLAVRGHPRRASADVSQLDFSAPEETFDAPVGRHSAKPPVIRERIVHLMGDLPRAELFARDVAPGWDAWGDEVEPTIAPVPEVGAWVRRESGLVAPRFDDLL